jgi:hypothetical protein
LLQDLTNIMNDETESPPDGVKSDDQNAHRKIPTWHRGDTVNYFPQRSDFFSNTFLQDYVLKGWIPHTPILTRGMKITAFGSCFAANITRHLSNIGFDLSSNRDPDIHISRIGDGLVNTASILGQFEWALENKSQPQGLWHGFKAEGYGFDEDIRLRTRDVFLGTEFFIITLGLSEVWYDATTGGTFWRGVPDGVFDARRHKFRAMSMAETKSDIARIYELVRTHVPDARVLFTVSPIPLAATFRDISCLTANTVSKAILRAALDEFLRDKQEAVNQTLFYFPSMEIVQFCFADPWGMDCRHPSSAVLDTVMKTFEASYCVGESTLDDANALFQMFRAQLIAELGQRAQGESERERLVREARIARRAGALARQQAKRHEMELNRIRAPEKPVVKKPDHELPAENDAHESVGRARRLEVRKAKREGREK